MHQADVLLIIGVYPVVQRLDALLSPGHLHRATIRRSSQTSHCGANYSAYELLGSHGSRDSCKKLQTIPLDILIVGGYTFP